MFYVPWNGNDTSLKSLCDVLRENSNGAGSIYVDGYSDTKKLSMIRCNRVKSELIIRTGVTENTFATTNNVGEFNGMKDVVVVTVVVPESEKEEIVAATQTTPTAPVKSEEKKQSWCPQRCPCIL